MDLHDVNKRIGELVRAERKALGLEQEELARLCGMTRVTICNIENGKANVTVRTIFNIAVALEIPISRFFKM
jgi:putative transcriptional regulator